MRLDLSNGHLEETGLMTFADKLSDLIFEGGWVVEVISDVLKAAFFGGIISMGNVLFYARRERQQLQKLKEYTDLLSVKEAVQKYSLKIAVVESGYLQSQIDHLEKLIQEHQLRAELYSKFDKIFSNAIPTLLLLFILFIGILGSSEPSGAITIFISVMGSIISYYVGKKVSKILDNLLVRRVSQVLISFTISSITLFLCGLILGGLP